MSRTSLIWTLIAAVPVGVAAVVSAFIYNETGKLPFQDADDTRPSTEIASEETPAQGETGSVEAKSPVADQPAGEPEEALEPEVVEQVPAAKPSFDVVGVEPTGETVVAGRSEAGAIVALVANGKVVGKSIANEVGEWTIILDEPFKPGDYDVGLEVHDEKGETVTQSDERLVVSLPEGGQQAPLVVLNAPDRPSDILQKPETEQKIAEATPQTITPDPSDTASTRQTSEQSEVTVADATEPAATLVEEVATSAKGDLKKQAEQVANAITDATEPKAAPESAETSIVEQAPNQNSQAETAVALDQTVTEPAKVEEAQTKVQETNAEAVAETVDRTPSAEGAVAETVSQSGGEVVVEATEETAQEQALALVATPQNKPDTADQPVTSGVSGSDQTEAAPALVTSAQKPETQVAAAQEQETTTETAKPVNVPDIVVTVEAVESENDKVFVAGTGNPDSVVRVYVDGEYLADATINAAGRWVVEGNRDLKAGDIEVRADLIGADKNTVAARAAVTFEKEEEQIVLTKSLASGKGSNATGQSAEVKKALPVVIIRKGDNLWRISRRLYGEGVRYTTIFQANQDQIRNPDLIYPGQVFLTPEGDLNWKELPDNNG